MVDRAKAQALLQGQAVVCAAPSGALRLYADDGVFLGVGAGGTGTVLPKRMWVRRDPFQAASGADVT